MKPTTNKAASRREPPPLLRALREARLRLRLPEWRPDGLFIGRALVVGALLRLMALLQTTLFSRFRPFGAIPDLMLPLVVAVAMTEGERWGGIVGLAAAFVIQSLGADTVTLLPLLYVPAGYLCPIITRLYLTDSIPVRAIYTAAAGVGRALLTLILLAIHVQSFSLPQLLWHVVLPEYAATLLLSGPVHVLVHAALRPFHKSRAERITTL